VLSHNQSVVFHRYGEIYIYWLCAAWLQLHSGYNFIPDILLTRGTQLEWCCIVVWLDMGLCLPYIGSTLVEVYMLK